MKKKSIIIVSTILVLIFIFLSTTQFAVIPTKETPDRVSTMPITPIIDTELVELSLTDNILNNINILTEWIKTIYSQLIQIVVK